MMTAGVARPVKHKCVSLESSDGEVVVAREVLRGSRPAAKHTQTMAGASVVMLAMGRPSEAGAVGRCGGDGCCLPGEMRNHGLFWAVKRPKDRQA